MSDRVTVYRGASGVHGEPILEQVTWQQVDDDHPNGVALPPSFGLAGKWAFVSGANILVAIPSEPAVLDMFGTVVEPGGAVQPINPYASALATRDGVVLLTLAGYVDLHNEWAETDPMLQPLSLNAAGVLYLEP